MTKNDLYSAVRSYLNRPQMPESELNIFAEVARGRLNTALRDHPRMVRVGIHTVPANEPLLPLPYDILFLKTVRRDDVLLRQYPATLTPETCDSMEEGYIAKGNCLELTHPPTEDTRYRVEYGQSLPSVASSVHWVRDWFPDVMLYSMLREAAIALKDRENGPVWDSHAERAIELLARQGWGQNIASGPRVVSRR